MMRLCDWLKTVVKCPNHKHLIWWHNEKKQMLAIHWKHASFSDYGDRDSALFKSWALQNNRYDPEKGDTAEEIKRWKTNLRCALASATNIIEESGVCQGKGKGAYKVYRLLEKPDPKKAARKKQSNIKAAKSKQKPQDQKRIYNSRLLKSRLKVEPNERHSFSHLPLTRAYSQSSNEDTAAVSNLSTKVEPMDILHYQTKVEPTSHYSCEDMPMDNLPTTLDDLHDDDQDGGYSSASSDTSCHSLDLCAGEQYISHDSRGSLDPVDTILRSRLGDEQYYDDIFYVDEGMPNDFEQETTINEWGQEVIYESHSGPNVTVQLFADRSVEMQEYTHLPHLPDGCHENWTDLTLL